MSQQSNPATLREALIEARKFIVVACGDKAPYVKVALARIDAALAASGTHSLPPQDGQHDGDRLRATEVRAALVSAIVCDTCIGQRQISNECESCLIGDGTRPCTCDEMPIFDCPQCDGRGWVHREPEKFKELCQQLYDTELNYLPDRTKAVDQAVAMNESASQGLRKASPEGEGREALSYAELDRRYDICRDEIIKLRHELDAALRQSAAPSGGAIWCDSCGQDVTGESYRPHRYVICHKPGCADRYVKHSRNLDRRIDSPETK